MSTASESGTYFKDIYADLKRRLPELPTGDPSPNLQECIGSKPYYVNFVRAEKLARQHNLSPEIITHLQEMALLQYSRDYHPPNIHGLLELLEEYGLTPSERSRIAQLIEQEESYPCFSFSKATERAAYLEDYSLFVREALVPPSGISRFIARIKGLFGRRK